ncbi:MAG: HK97 gp10 family phage protein [Prolixibacteraceae bacterium]|nr:HK97 gp10 family phage protein [Prolixibacteraceae bacterium]HOA20635.1 HK97 gp10 family phage protein [Sedimentibacter sp.]
MAKAVMKMPEDFLLKISKLGDKTDEIIPKVLEAGGKVVKEKVKSNLQSIIGTNIKGKSRSTGELVSALGVSPALIDKNGNSNVKVGFSEPRSDGKSNSMIAGVLEYGKSGQPPKPFLKPAKSASRKACINAMIEAFDKEVENL